MHSEYVPAHPNSHTPMCTHTHTHTHKHTTPTHTHTNTQHPHIHTHKTQNTHPHTHTHTHTIHLHTHTDDEDLGQNFRISFHHSNGLCCSISAQTRRLERFKNISVKGHRLISLQLPSTAKSDDIISTGLCEAQEVFWLVKI